MNNDFDSAAVRFEDLGNVGQVILALLVLRLDSFQGVEQISGLETVNAGVYLANFSFLFGGVFLFDDLFKPDLVVANDAVVTGRVFQTHCEDRARGVSRAMMID